MAISRMQQPRQNYGLGSFVKKAVGKITKPFTKIAGKIVPKEIAGIMRTAAPFLPPGYREAAYLLGTAKQTGRVSPVDLALTFAPQIGKIPTGGGYSLSDRIGNIKIPFTDRFPDMKGNQNKDLSEIFFGRDQYGRFEGPMPETGNSSYIQKTLESEGLFGKGGKKFQIGSDDVGIFDTKAGQKLFGTFDKEAGKYVPSYLKIGSLGLGAADYINTQKQLEKLNEGASQVVDESVPGGGITDSEAYDKFVERLALLNPESFRVPEQFRLPAQAGGLMRENFALGTRPTAQESGLGGLPIEADMRYTGGFMPYGAVEKADDVPARLSKNEFVFTADAVRAAGGGSVNKGAKKMYQAMKQLEKKPEAKGMMA